MWGAPQAVMIRNHVMLWTLSIGFELMELTFQHLLPNFNECWWDRFVPRFLPSPELANFAGLHSVPYEEMHGGRKLFDACAMRLAQLAAGRAHLQLAGNLGGHAHGEVVWVRPDRRASSGNDAMLAPGPATPFLAVLARPCGSFSLLVGHHPLIHRSWQLSVCNHHHVLVLQQALLHWLPNLNQHSCCVDHTADARRRAPHEAGRASTTGRA